MLNIDGDKLFKDLLTNQIFSGQILSGNFKMTFWLNRGLVWEFLGWKLISVIEIMILFTMYGLTYKICNIWIYNIYKYVYNIYKHIYTCASACICLYTSIRKYIQVYITAQKMKLSIKDFFNKCNQICSKQRFDHIYWRNP